MRLSIILAQQTRTNTYRRIYLGLQDTVTRKHFARWLKEAAADPSAKPIMMIARHVNMETSLRVFCGYHIPDHAVEEINDKYWLITQSLELVNFPIPLPGTKVYKAIQARKIVMYWLELAASKSKIAMAEGGSPECMMDEWVSIMAEPGYKGRKDFSDYEMAQVVFSFLFASQDAMSSGVIYGFQHLADHPEVLDKVRKEQERVRMGNYEDPMTLEMMDEMVYLQAVVKESMRVKPPVTMVRIACRAVFLIVTSISFSDRFHTSAERHSRSLTTIPSQLAAWSSHHFITLSTIPKSTPNPTNFTLNDG